MNLLKKKTGTTKSILQELRNHQSVFRQITIIFIVLVLGMSCVMAAWLNHLSAENHQKVIAEADLGRIEATSTGMEQNLDAVGQMVAQMLWSMDFCDYMVTVKDNQAQAYRIARQLTSCTRGENNILKKVWFCSGFGDRVFQSDSYEILNKEESEVYQKLIAVRDDWSLFLRDPDQDMYSYLLPLESSLYMIVTLNTGHELGIVMCEIDQDMMVYILRNKGQSADNIYVYDANGTPVFAQALDYSAMDSLDLSESNQIRKGRLTPNTHLHKGNVYYYASSHLGWQYFSPIDWDSMHIGIAQTARSWVPAILLLALFAICLSYYLIRTIYQPIQALVRMVDPQSGRGKGHDGKNEFDVLAGAYSSAQQKNEALTSSTVELLGQSEKLQATIDQMAPDVLESTLRKILNGRSYERDYLEDILHGINSDMPARGRFVVYGCLVEPPENRQVSEREHTLYLASIQNLLREVIGQRYPMTLVLMERYILAAVIAFPEDCSAVTIKMIGQEMEEAIEEAARPLPYRLWVDRGQICNHLAEARESYSDSLEKIQYKRYAATSGNALFREPGDTMQNENMSSGLNQAYYREKTKETLQYYVDGRIDEGRRALVQLLEEIDHQECALPDRKHYYMMLLDEMVEKVVAYPMTREDMEQISEQSILEEIEKESNEAVIAALVNRRCKELCQLVYSYGKKSQYKYVEQAKSFLEANYVNSNLALNDVAEHIGISGSYLSELFNEVSGKKFSAYLADYRVEKARQLLQATTLTITDIGFQCGFNSVQNFIRVFKKVTGYTPGQYRDMKNGN